MRGMSRLLLMVTLIGSFVLSVCGIYEMRSMRIFTAQDLQGSMEQLSLPGQGLSLLAENGNHLYLGGRDAVYQVLSANLSQVAKVAKWPAAAARLVRTDGAGGALVRSVYFPGNSSDTVFVCAVVGSGNHACHQFDRRGLRGEDAWRPASTTPVSREISTVLLPPSFASAGKSQRPPLSMKRADAGSCVFFAALPPIRDQTDLVELTGPAFAKIGFTTADLNARRSRALWMARDARAHLMHEAGDRLYTVYTEPAVETRNYVDSINDGERPGLVKMPIFTRLSRVCLNDPGQTINNQTSPRVLTSFFKMRLICRHDGADFDVLELATEVFSGQFIGLFAGQNSPPDGFRAICRFRLAEAERMLSGDGGGDRGFIEMSRLNWQSPWQASRLSRADFQRRSDFSRPFDCVWTPDEAKLNRFSSLLISRTASLLAQPVVSAALTVLPPKAATGRRPTALTVLPASLVDGVKLDQLIIGWDTGEVTRLVVSAAAALSPAVETLQALPPGQAVDSAIVRHQRLLVFSSDGASAVPLTRCGGGGGGGGGCADCALLGDPFCAWVSSPDGSGGSCVDLATLRGRSAAEVADAAAATTDCAAAAAGGRNTSAVASLRGLPLSPPAVQHDPRHLSSVGGRGSGRSDEASPDGMASAGIGTGAFLGALVGASLIAFLFGVAIGVGCLADSSVASCRGKRPPLPTPSSSSHQQPLSSVSTSSTSSSSTSQRRPRRRGSESGLMSSASRFLLRGLITKAPVSTEEVAKLAEDSHQARGPKASEPGILPQSRTSSDQRLRCRDNEYVQAADLVPIATVAEVSGTTAPRSLGSSWESCVNEAAHSETVVCIGEAAVEPPPRQPQLPRHQVTVNAGIIGQLSLSVGFTSENT